MEINKLIIVVSFLVVYQEDTQIMYINLQNIKHMNIVYKIYIFPLVLLVVRTVRVMIQSKIPSYIINIRINARNETISPKNHKMNFLNKPNIPPSRDFLDYLRPASRINYWKDKHQRDTFLHNN